MKTASGRKRKAPPAESLHKLIAYQIHEDDFAPIRPAHSERGWMDETIFSKFAYRCLPLVIANQYGWENLSTHHIRVSWDGTSRREGLVVENLSGDGRLHAASHFGLGVLTFQIPFLFKTPGGWNLMVRGPMNRPKDGIVALEGVVETDWSHATFTMNWRFTRACTVEFGLGEPICHFFPVPRGAGKQKPDVVAQGWQKDYLQAAKDKKLLAQEFVDQRPRNESNQSDGNHESP